MKRSVSCHGKVVVVGAGTAGLAAAYTLRKHGIKPIVFKASDQVGAHRNPPPGSRLPCDDEYLFTRIYKWEEAVCITPPGMLRAMADMSSPPGMFLAGDYMRMPSVNGALASGVDAANGVAALLRDRPASA